MADYDDIDFVFTTEDGVDINESDVDDYLKTIDEVDYGPAMGFNDSKQHAIDVYDEENHGESVAMHIDGSDDPYVIIFNDGDIYADDGATHFSSIDEAKKWLASQYQDDTTASVKQAHLDGWEDAGEPGVGFRRYPRDYCAYAFDSSTGVSIGFSIESSSPDHHTVYEGKNMTGTLEEMEAAADTWYKEYDFYVSHNEASVKQAHDVSNLDAAIVSLSDQLALDPDTELADLLDELVEYRQSESEETAEDEIEEHGENVPITESAKHTIAKSELQGSADPTSLIYEPGHDWFENPDDNARYFNGHSKFIGTTPEGYRVYGYAAKMTNMRGRYDACVNVLEPNEEYGINDYYYEEGFRSLEAAEEYLDNLVANNQNMSFDSSYARF